MPRFELSLELTPTSPEERVALPCLGCERAGCEWKLHWPLGASAGQKGLHTQCKVSFEGRRSPSRTFQAVKP